MGIPATLSTVPAQTPYIQYVATSGQTVFPYPFEITQDSDLVAVANGTTFATDSGYTLSGVGNSTGGNLTFTSGRTAGDIITLYRDIPIERLTQFAQNGGFSSTAFNAEFNNIYLLLQQLQQNLDQCLQVPNTNNPAPTVSLTPANYASKYLAFDPAGNPIPTSPPSFSISTGWPQTAINVLNTPYSADPTGVNDSTTAINNACTAAAAKTTGGVVYIPAGNYKTTSTINRPANVRIVGDGSECTVINATGNYAIIAATGSSSNVLNGGGVEKVRLIGVWGSNSSNTSSVGISESWTNRSIIRDVNIQGCYRGMYGIALWQVIWDNVQVNGTGTLQNSYGFYLDQLPTTFPSGTSNAVNAVNCLAQGVATAGYKLLNPNGSKFVNCEAENGVTGWDIGNTGSGCYPIEFLNCDNCLADSSSGNGFQVQQGSNASACTYMQFSNCWSSTHGQSGFYLNGCVYINIENLQAGNNTNGAVLLSQCQYCCVVGGIFQLNNTANASGIGDVWIANGAYNRIEANISNMAHSTSPSVLESNGTNSNTIIDNTLFQGATIVGAATVTRNNQGYRTETVGTATVGAAATSVTVTHGLAVTPNVDSILLTPTTAWGSAASWWVSNVGATTFQINTNAAPGGSGMGFSYQINLNTVY